MVCLRVLARIGRRTVCARALAFLPPQVLLPCQYFAPSGCAPKSVETRKSPSYLMRRLATAGLQLAEVMMTRIWIIQRCTRGRFAPAPALWRASFLYHPARAMAVRKCSNCCQVFRAFLCRALFVRGMAHPYLVLSRFFSTILWRILSLIHCSAHGRSGSG
jgi:hypothetical protein